MPQLRKDPITGRWVIIAPERADRPHAIVRMRPEENGEPCPFCPGNESMTPPELLVHRPIGGAANGPGWTLRVVPNKFPALRVESQMFRRGQGPYDLLAGIGAHEVIIETAEHARQLHEQGAAQIHHVLAAFQSRMLDLVRDERLRHIVFFKNSGPAAGATLPHPHSQLVALPMVPGETRLEMDAAARHFAEKERCIFCDVIDHEMHQRERVVLETESFVALSPWAARTPFELALLPKEHRSQFEAAGSHELSGLAEALRLVLRKLDRALERPAVNLWLHTLPLREPRSPSYHWHLEIKPVISLQGGFEWASGFTINPTPPEEAAAFLRQTEVPA